MNVPESGKYYQALSQISGTASLTPYAGHEQEFIDRLKIMGVYAAAAKIMAERLEAPGKGADSFEEGIIKALKRFNLIKIEPEEITYLWIHPTEGAQKNIWKKASA